MFGISSGDDNFVEKKFSPVVFLTSIEGILKLVAIVLIILSTSLHVLYSSCGDVPAWYPLLFPIGTGACGVVCLIFYLFYVSGLVKNHFHTWNAIDIIIATLSFVVLIAVSILTLVNCKDPRNPIEYVFSPLALIAAVCIAGSASVSLIKFRVDKDPVMEENNDEIPHNVHGISAAQYRKSVVI